MMGLLDQFAILNEMSPEERESLFEFLEESSYEDGRAIFRDHDEAAELVLVTAGDVRLEAGGHAVGELKAGAALGHASLVSIGHRACAAYARGAVSALKLSRESYLRLRSDHPHIALVLQEALLRSFAETTREVLPSS